MSILNDLIAHNERLQQHVWTVLEIRAIPNEALARAAYYASESLRKQYPSEELFVAHWLGQRRRYGLAAQSGPDAGPLDEPKVRQEWNNSPPLQTEFAGSFESYLAFLRADRRGSVRIA
jgi:hypothetical protein